MPDLVQTLGWSGIALLILHVCLHELPLFVLTALALLAPKTFSRLKAWWSDRNNRNEREGECP